MSIQVEPYKDAMHKEWDDVLSGVRQRTFLFRRDFMDYHRDRFVDQSLVYRDKHGHIVALLPACKDSRDSTVVQSHSGLTYGGFLTTPKVSALMMQEIWEETMAHYHRQGYRSLVYKPVPYIYASYPADEDLYWLFRLGGKLIGRAVASVVNLREPLPFSSLRQRKIKSADRVGNLRFSAEMNRLEAFWQVLDDVLMSRHHVHPVHTCAELQKLAEAFPENILLLTANKVTTPVAEPQELMAGCMLFVTDNVVHVQYIASSDDGCKTGALDWLFSRMFGFIASQFPRASYLDFGNCTEDGGRFLNEGLIFQKEGFGGRAVCYDTYQIDL